MCILSYAYTCTYIYAVLLCQIQEPLLVTILLNVHILITFLSSFSIIQKPNITLFFSYFTRDKGHNMIRKAKETVAPINQILIPAWVEPTEGHAYTRNQIDGMLRYTYIYIYIIYIIYVYSMYIYYV